MNKSVTPAVLYKILSFEDWKKCDGEKIFTPAYDIPFVHFSTATQVPGVLAKKFADCPYIVLKVDVAHLVGRLALEWDSKKTDQYWHLYDGYIPMSAVSLDSMCSVKDNVGFGEFSNL